MEEKAKALRRRVGFLMKSASRDMNRGKGCFVFGVRKMERAKRFVRIARRIESEQFGNEAAPDMTAIMPALETKLRMGTEF